MIPVTIPPLVTAPFYTPEQTPSLHRGMIGSLSSDMLTDAALHVASGVTTDGMASRGHGDALS